MSIRSITTLAVARDAAIHKTPAKGGGAGAGQGSTDQTYLDALTSAIPTEPVSAYTALLAIVVATKSGDLFLAVRWWAYGVFLAVVAASVLIGYTVKKSKPAPVGVAPAQQRRVPVLEICSATAAAAAWGLVAPGSALQNTVQGAGGVVTMGAITIGGAVLLSLMAPFLTTGSATS